ncbi:MAG: acetyl-CoA carboxylase carboxyltransferase subunit alpha [Ammonifex sp.]|nr:MAG: acetyl-CoA carboxylase carboxyltransferase subunit alpha [Ammonifex sp.]
MPAVLDFEKPLIELESKIAELTSFSEEKGLDLSDEIDNLKRRADELKSSIFANLTPWQQVQLARHPDRPNTEDYVRMLFEDFLELHGDRCYSDDPAIYGGIGLFQGTSVTVIGHLKGRDTKENVSRNFGMAHPEGFRKALRLMEQAEKFRRPVISFLDTPGAHCGIGAEERGQSQAIAQNLLRMSVLRIPIIVIVIGEGGSGGALALGVGNRTLMLEHAIFSVITPEGCASILWKDAARAREAAEALKLTAQDLLSLRIVDEVVPEPLGGAHRDPYAAADLLRKSLARNLESLKDVPPEELVQRRYAKYRNIGSVGG